MDKIQRQSKEDVVRWEYACVENMPRDSRGEQPPRGPAVWIPFVLQGLHWESAKLVGKMLGVYDTRSITDTTRRKLGLWHVKQQKVYRDPWRAQIPVGYPSPQDTKLWWLP